MTDVNPIRVLAAVGILIAAGVLLIVALAAMMNFLERKPAVGERRAVARNGSSWRDVPRLQVAPGDERARFRAREEAELSGYAWMDRTHGIIRIPIERAIDLLADRGLPSRPAVRGSEQGDWNPERLQERPSPSEAANPAAK